MDSSSHHDRMDLRLPDAEASSAYHTCFRSSALSNRRIRGVVARAYSGIAKGSPWVVPSSDNRVMPSTNRSVGSL